MLVKVGWMLGHCAGCFALLAEGRQTASGVAKPLVPLSASLNTNFENMGNTHTHTPRIFSVILYCVGRPTLRFFRGSLVFVPRVKSRILGL